MDSRDEPPVVKESARILGSGRGEQSLASAEVLGDGGQQGVEAGVPGRDGLGSNEVMASVDRSPLDEWEAPERKPKSSGLVVFGKTRADLEANVGNIRTLVGHPHSVEAGCIN
jgi:hypothetical protein